MAHPYDYHPREGTFPTRYKIVRQPGVPSDQQAPGRRYMFIKMFWLLVTKSREMFGTVFNLRFVLSTKLMSQRKRENLN